MKTISDKKQKLIDEKNNSPLTVGERIEVYERAVGSRKDSERSCTCTIASLEDGITVRVGAGREADKNRDSTLYKIKKDDISSRSLLLVGANPFEEIVDSIRPIAFSLDSILFKLDVLNTKRADKGFDINGVVIKEAEWNPFVYDKDGKKQYYQRGLCWIVSDKQLLIESIYQNIDCGKILVRKRGLEELRRMQKNGETELSFNDIVDGKQRLNAIKCFMNDEFVDLQGNYYSDLSNMSQHKFENHQLFSYAEMPENTKDSDVIKQFLKLNFSGVPQSREHIDFIKSINDKLK